jgi:uncharacterized protein YbjT (DUF2867 family)
MNRIAAVFGATGAQGLPVVGAARQAGWTVRGVASSAESVRNKHGSEVEAVGANLADTARLEQALQGVDAAFLHLPMPRGPDEPQQFLNNFLAAAAKVRLPLLVFSTSGPARAAWARSAVVAGKLAAVQALLSGPVPAIVLQPTLYLENLQVSPFHPRLHSEGVLDYPPLRPAQKLSWTSQLDQALVAAAALGRPELAGRAFEVASRQPLSGAELAAAIEPWVGRAVRYEALSPAAFGQRVGAAFGSPETGEAVGGLYQALHDAGAGQLEVDTAALEAAFGVQLGSATDRIRAWGRAGVPA